MTWRNAFRGGRRGRKLAVAEIYRSRDGRYSIERAVDRYLIYDERAEEPGEEIWSCRAIGEVYEWIAAHGLSVADFDEVS